MNLADRSRGKWFWIKTLEHLGDLFAAGLFKSLFNARKRVGLDLILKFPERLHIISGH